MPSVILVVDESGSKGFSDNRESVTGEFGVMAGLLIPAEYKSRVEVDVNYIASKFHFSGKRHITTLRETDQKNLRKEIFDYLLSRSARWVYEAIYVEGMHSWQKNLSEFTDMQRADSQSRIKRSQNKRSASLHQELFTGVFGKSVEFCIDQLGRNVSVDVVTDRVDDSVLKLFDEAAQKVLHVGNWKQKVSGYNPDSQKVVKGVITLKVTKGMEHFGDLSGVKHSIAVSQSALTIVADVMVNSVHHHLRSLQSSKPGCALNTAEAIAGHPLASIVYGVAEAQIADTVFRYPK
ncbi:MAG: hypothetical protein LBG44_11410 [Gemmatimonadota bacterium]|jgi:hypothetical protein|nr:hypothetical protein [Gemmatimonadota bacterium]